MFCIWYFVIGVWYLVFGIWCSHPIAGILYLVFCNWCFVIGVWYLVFSVWYLVFGIWYLVFGVHIPLQVFCIWLLKHWKYHLITSDEKGPHLKITESCISLRILSKILSRLLHIFSTFLLSWSMFCDMD